MKRVLAFAALSALLAVSSATVQCDNYLNNFTYREAIGRWIACYTWPGSNATDLGLEFHVPTREEILDHRSFTPTARIDPLTDNPKLVAKSLYSNVDILLDFSADRITRVKGYYSAYDTMPTDQYKLRRIGDFLVIDICKIGEDECVSEAAWLMHRERRPDRAAVAEAAACVVVPGKSGQAVIYRTK